MNYWPAVLLIALILGSVIYLAHEVGLRTGFRRGCRSQRAFSEQKAKEQT